MDTLKLSIVTPNGEIFNDDVKTKLFLKRGRVRCFYQGSIISFSLTVGAIVIEKKPEGSCYQLGTCKSGQKISWCFAGWSYFY